MMTIRGRLMRVIIPVIVVYSAICGFPVPLQAAGTPIADLEEFPQNPFRYISGPPDEPFISTEEGNRAFSRFRNHLFAPWDRKKPAHSMDAVMWPWRAFTSEAGDLAGANLRPPGEGWFESMKERAVMERFGTLNERGIVVRETDLRNFPSVEPLFRNASLPGEGFPFDYLQQTVLRPGEPLFVSHLSAEGGWAFVESPQAAGWVDIRDIAFVDEDFVTEWMSRPLAVVVAEDVTVRDSLGRFVFSLGVGAVAPLDSPVPDLKGYRRVLLPLRDANGKAALSRGYASQGGLARLPLEYTPWNMAKIMAELAGRPYGWGAILGNRDCSAMLKDLFAPFGFWLPRHSADQAGQGERINLKGLSPDEKESEILEKGIPFRTLLWLPGHVMLYAGAYRGRAAVFHAFWGIRTRVEGRQGREIVGTTAFTSLEPGKELPFADLEATYLKRLESMTILFR